MVSAQWRTRLPLLGITVLLVMVSKVQAGPLLPVVEITEVLMDVQGAEASFIGRTFGPDSSSPLSFTSSVDVAGNNFSFALNPGTTYRGQAIALTGSGAFNATTGAYDWSTTGTLGSSPLNGTGTFVFTGTTGNGTGRWPPSGSPYVDWESTVDLSLAPLSITDVTFTVNGVPVSTVPIPGPDSYDSVTGALSWGLPGANVDNQSFTLMTTGFSPGSGGAGNFTTFILPTPEPSSLLLAVLSALGGRLFLGRQRPRQS